MGRQISRQMGRHNYLPTSRWLAQIQHRAN
jgi:hypothetical protein